MALGYNESMYVYEPVIKPVKKKITIDGKTYYHDEVKELLKNLKPL